MHELPPAALTRPLDSAAAGALGLSWKTMQSKRFSRLYPGVYVHVDLDLTHDVQLAAAHLKMPSDAVVSGVSAARLWGFSPSGHRQLHFSTRSPTRTTALPGVVLHRHQGRIDSTVRHGLPVTDPVRTIVDCARCLHMVPLIQLIDHLVNEQVTSLDFIASTVHRMGWHGVRRTRRLLPYARQGSESPMETLLRLMLHFARLPQPELNVDVIDRSGAFVARVDLLYDAWKVAVEYDGRHHERDPRQRQRDRERRERLEALGYRVIVITDVDLRRPRDIVARVHAALAQRGYSGRPVLNAMWQRWFGPG